jgi:hypothetical protein
MTSTSWSTSGPLVTRVNWRMDCGVAGYDNTFGLPPFFPTRLRFEDYIYRLWVQQGGIVAAHVDAAQHHMKSNYMRNPPAAEIFNEEVSNLLKRKIKSTVSHLDALTIGFDYEGEVTGEDAREILDKIAALHQRALKAAETARTERPRAGVTDVCRQPGEGVLQVSSQTSSSKTCCGLSTTWLESSRRRFSYGPLWLRSRISRSAAMVCPRLASNQKK